MFTRGGAMDKTTEQYVTALKKGATLLKYGRRGKPKFCPFRLSQDEMELIYHLGKDEKYLKLSTVTSLSTGQKTAVFQRHPRPHQDHLSFSLIHSGGERSLDLICKDEDEFEIWYKGLKALFLAHQRRLHSAGQQSSPVRSLKDAAGYFHSESNLTNRTTISTRSTPPASPQSALLEYHPPAKPDARPLSRSASAGEAIATVRSLDGKRPTYEPSDSGASVVEGLPMRSVSSELPRVLLSSAASTSSNNDDENLGDVYMWGEGLGDGVLGGGSLRVGSGGPGAHVDALMPKLMESTVVLDVQMIACGGRHAALVNRQGETFCWGEEAGGRLGHGVDSDVQQPEIVDGFAGVQMEKVACGEYHTCAVSTSGELFTWGDGSYGCGLLGHGNDLSHWMPKRIEALDGIKIAEVACGPWHTAAVSTSGRLYTWGDGTFGALGHGTRATVTTPREVETLKELRVSKVACGVWHTAAVVEHTTADGLSSLNRLYTWGDGDKCRLGHGNKETKWVPTVVEALLGESVVQVACGHSMTVALTSAGSVFTCGSGVYGQLGNPSASGKVPQLVEGKLKGQFVDQIACGAFHVVALTSTQHIYSWGKGANGRLGMGDTKDREFPTLVEALKDKQVVAISCGSSFTAAICTHKWASGEDHSKCNHCKNAFTLTRRRHNCYNCGLVFCHSCSSKKALKAALSPNPAKPSRVCDTCFNKLSKAADIGDSFTLPAWKMGVPKNNVRSVGKAPVAPPKPAPANDPLPYRTNVSGPGRKEGARTGRVTPSPFPNASDGRPPPAIAQNPAVANLRERPPASRTPPRGQSPTRRGAAPNSGSSSPRGGYEELKRINDSLHQEVVRLNAQVEKLAVRCEELEEESRFVRADAEKKVAQANAAAHEEANKGRASEEVIRSLLAQIQDMAERLPEDSYRYGRIGAVPIKANETSPVTRSPEGSICDDAPPPVSADPRLRAFSLSPATGLANRPMELSVFQSAKWDVETSPRGSPLNLSMTSSQGGGQSIETDSLNEKSTVVSTEGAFATVTEKPPRPGRSKFSASSESRDGERVEQVSQGVYLTLRTNSQGEMELKRVRFSRKLFSESEAERWWAENRARVLGNFGIHVT